MSMNGIRRRILKWQRSRKPVGVEYWTLAG